MSEYREEPQVVEADDTESALTARDVYVAIRRRWWIVAVVLVAVVSVWMWRTMQQPRLYQTSATVRVSQAPVMLPGMQAGPRYDYRVDPLLSEQQLIRSQEVSERVARRLGLRLQVVEPERLRRTELFGTTSPVVTENAREGNYILALTDRGYALQHEGLTSETVAYGDTLLAHGLQFVIPGRPRIDGGEVTLRVMPLNQAAGIVRGGVSTRVIERTDIVHISYIGTDPRLVQQIVNAVAHEYEDYSRVTQQTTARSRVSFIEESLREQSRVVNEARIALRNFKEQYQTSDVGTELAALLENIHGYERQAQSTRAEQTLYGELVGRLSAADTADDALRRLAGTEAVANNTYIASLYDRWFELSSTREDLLRDFTPASAEVQAVDRRIRQTKLELQEASRHYLSAIGSRLESLTRTISDLRRQAERYPPLEAEQARLMAQVRTAEETHNRLAMEHHMSRISAMSDEGNVRVIDEAEIPGWPVAPSRRRALMFSTLFGLLLGVSLATALEKMDSSIKSPDELVDRFDVPVLGMIPALRADGRDGGGRDSGRLVAHRDPRSPAAESYRSLRTNLAFARANQDVRTLVLTSPGPADGKSTTVANLAITFAQQGQAVLLVDADLRRAMLDRIFEVPRSPGLTDVIIGESTIEQAASETAVPNLHVIPSGHFPPNPSEMLGSAAMRRMLEDARSSYDVILLDSPPLLAVTDAAILSTMVDGTILVVRMGSTVRHAVSRALSQLRAVRTRVLGSVLNDIDVRRGAAYGGYGYYYYHQYYAHDENGGNGRKEGGVMGRLKGLTGGRGRARAG